MDRDRIVELATKLFVTVLFVLSAAGLVVSLRTGDGIASALFGVYLTGMLVAGVFRDATDTPGWQLAFFGGVAVWGGWEYVASGDLFSLLLAALGVVMVATNLAQFR